MSLFIEKKKINKPIFQSLFLFVIGSIFFPVFFAFVLAFYVMHSEIEKGTNHFEIVIKSGAIALLILFSIFLPIVYINNVLGYEILDNINMF